MIPQGFRCFGLLCLGVLWGLFVPAAQACQVCIPMPVKTLADRLLEADAVVLAREDPNRHFYYVAIETLKGDPGDAPIDVFMNSQARRILASYPERGMVLARDPRGGAWAALGIADVEYGGVVRRVLEYADVWKPGETNNPQRLAEFARLLGHPDSRLHELAYLEIGRAPYAAIRRISAEVSIETVRAMLDNPRYLEWRSLAILMLAQSGRPADRTRILTSFDGKQRFGSTLNLAAWATAYIAVEGSAGIERIERLYLARPERSREQLQEILRALSVHGAEDRQLRDRVVTAYRTVLEVHPKLAPKVARDLIAWRRWDFVEPMRGIREAVAKTDPLGAYALDLYLRMAASGHHATAGDDSSGGAGLPGIIGQGAPLAEDVSRR